MIPMKIHSLWNTGWQEPPSVVAKVRQSWDHHAGDYEVNALQDDDLQRHMEELGLSNANLTIQAASDLLRTKLLFEQGGIWLDATCLLSDPLSNWISDATSESGFFAFTRPGADRLISSWCLASEAGTPMLEDFLSRLVKY
ncbi:hypothetical protein B6V72_03130 [Thioclava sp. F34-6]|uniref:glycosyltransferase family 32 protein n=1 Tax=Thioclava sp. F34-6 TaxID=1973003 RepID=UPI000B543A57|nr:capsular polysaccharide synthesis protein [Thioclava sp. F34-6]OWY15584.1 hypothetical protein B6V72_03130 [Thioclava sp. F34-6]